jgi:hypothetical protein
MCYGIAFPVPHPFSYSMTGRSRRYRSFRRSTKRTKFPFLRSTTEKMLPDTTRDHSVSKGMSYSLVMSASLYKNLTVVFTTYLGVRFHSISCKFFLTLKIRVFNTQCIGSFCTQFTINQPIPQTRKKECTMVFKPMY